MFLNPSQRRLEIYNFNGYDNGYAFIVSINNQLSSFSEFHAELSSKGQVVIRWYLLHRVTNPAYLLIGGPFRIKAAEKTCWCCTSKLDSICKARPMKLGRDS